MDDTQRAYQKLKQANPYEPFKPTSSIPEIFQNRLNHNSLGFDRGILTLPDLLSQIYAQN